MKVIVHTPFTLIRDDGVEVSFVTGLCDMLKDDFEHWYAQLHVDVEKAEKIVKSKVEALPTNVSDKK